MEYNITHVEDENIFVVEVEAKTAYLEYEIDDEEMDILHTIVPVSLEGKGIGSALMKTACEYALDNDLKIIPSCSFAYAYLKRNKSKYKGLSALSL